jgi:hypothetical protein
MIHFHDCCIYDTQLFSPLTAVHTLTRLTVMTHWELTLELGLTLPIAYNISARTT